MLATKFDQRLSAFMRVDGSAAFRRNIVPDLLRALTPGSTVYDLGAGRVPLLSPEVKRSLGVRLKGLDLHADEMAQAPAGLYDETIAADVTTYHGRNDADLVVSHCLLEHVPDNVGAWKALASMLKPGGRAAVFQPCRNAAFARFNLICPAPLARLLLGLQPGRRNNGWKAYYDRCTPSSFKALAEAAGLEVVRIQPFWMAGYYRVFFPVHVAWRAWQNVARRWLADDACESFMIEVVKPRAAAPEPAVAAP